MKTIELRVNKKIYDKLMWLLSQFKSEDLIIIDKKAIDKNYLDNQLDEIDNGDAEFLTLNQLDLMLDERIKKHEN
ncbi:MAG: hypothetical protein R6W85_09870 [Gillisia sp.]